MISNVKNEINVASAFLPTEAIKSLSRSLSTIQSRDIKVKCLMSSKLVDNPLLDELKERVDIKIGIIPDAGMIIIDDDEILFGAIELEDDKLSNILGIWTRDKQLVKFCKMIFELFYSTYETSD